MRFYFAPLEGITGYVYRNVYGQYFDQIDRYYSPFISTTQKRAMRNKELRDILPENNQGMQLIPQILSNNAQDFLFTARFIHSLGYDTVNLNLGCPSRTVVSKGKGAGFLERPFALHRFLEEIYSQTDVKISIKTRLGKDDPDDILELMELFNQYPVEELIIHPRVQQDFYKNKPNWKLYGEACKQSRNPVCYNGDLFTPADFHEFKAVFPQTKAVMLGRGLLMNPDLTAVIKGEPALTSTRLREFIDCLYERYREVLSGDTTVLFKMKEIWGFLIHRFESGDKYGKRIRKCSKLKEYEAIIQELFLVLELKTLQIDQPKEN